MAAENNLWSSLKPRLQKAGLFHVRIETSTGDGVPDLWIGEGDWYCWVELKAQKEWPKRDTTKVFGRDGLRVEQIAWHIAASQKRLRSVILCGVGVSHARQTFIVPSHLAEHFNDMTRTELTEYAVPLDSTPATLLGWPILAPRGQRVEPAKVP
jgi:hypothetical protein